VYRPPEEKKLLRCAREAYRETWSVFAELYQEFHRHIEAAGPNPYDSSVAAAETFPGDAQTIETIVAGFVAIKVLGPFLEAWAKKLGEQFGESTAVRGRTLHWYEKEERWITEQELRAAESLQGWRVRYTWTVAEGQLG